MAKQPTRVPVGQGATPFNRPSVLCPRFLSSPGTPPLNKSSSLIPAEGIQRTIFPIRGEKVMLGADLALLYGVTTGNVSKAVKRNLDRFSADFMFQLNCEEAEDLRFQTGISSSDYGGGRCLPYAFPEQGVAMLSSVRRGKRAARVNVAIMRAFVQLRRALAGHAELARKLGELERRSSRQADFALHRAYRGLGFRKRDEGHRAQWVGLAGGRLVGGHDGDPLAEVARRGGALAGRLQHLPVSSDAAA